MMRLLFLLFMIHPFSGYGLSRWTFPETEGFAAGISLSDNDLELLKPFKVTLTLRYPQDYTINEDTLQENLLRHVPVDLAPFDLVDFEKETVDQGASKSSILTYTLEPLKEGGFPLTFYNISFNSKNTPFTIISGILQVTVHSPFLDKAFLNPFPPLNLNHNPPIELSDSNRQLLMPSQKDAEHNFALYRHSHFPWLEVFIALLVSVWFVILKIYPPKKEVRPEKRISQARNTALANLMKIRKNVTLPDTQFYMDLSGIIKNYMEQRYQLHASTDTTPEFLEELRSDPALPSKMHQQITTLLTEMDQVKFAKHDPTQEERDTVSNIALKLIMESR